uniref:FAD-binding FR-type domain-containing protein n=1 Tax=Globisporangium ultimum (strain ATCC 200006 / CBS 805.95 / DAOM BR144) TaxID=431595 RepID=K3WXM5_GLOUD
MAAAGRSRARDLFQGFKTLLKNAFTVLARLVIVLGVLVYMFGILYFLTPLNTLELENAFTEWWGLAHFEMVRPTFLVLACTAPMLLSVLLFEWIQWANVHRVSSGAVLSIGRWMRRKPQIATWISWFSYGEWFFLFFIVGGNVLVFYYGFDRRYQMARMVAGDDPIEFNKYLSMVGVTLGFNCVYNAAFLFLPATRNCAWMTFLNISYANGIKYHRWLGVVTVLAAFVHCACYYWSWIRQGVWQEKALPCFDCDLDTRKGAKVWMNVFGEVALLSFLAIGLSSIPYVRRNFYDAFYYVHQLFFVAVIFMVLHWRGAIWYILPSFVLYLAHRFLSSANALAPVDIAEFTTMSNELLKIVVSQSISHRGEFKIGQFVYLNVPSISRLQWHAFTIASSPRMSAHTLTILVKSLGDWTKDLVEYSAECKQKNVQPVMYMDGYYGSSLELYQDYPTVCLIGGGVGVTPLFAILEDIVARLSQRAELRQRVYFVFTFRELELLEEIHPLLARIRERDPHEQYFGFYFSLTRVPTDEYLDQQLNRHVPSTHQISFHDKSSFAASPFSESLKPSALRSLTYALVFSSTVALVSWLEFGGGKITQIHASLWPVQNGAEVLALFVAAWLVYLLAFMEKQARKCFRASMSNQAYSRDERRQRRYMDTRSGYVPQLDSSSDVHTLRDLIADYKVSVGKRPDIHDVLRHVYAGHAYTSSTSLPIAMFVSGPESMKSSVKHAAAELGSQHFDIHEEEFEL